MKLLKAEGLAKNYRKRWVVNEVSLDVCSGEVVGLLGPNGAGKTTTFHMISGLIRPAQGRITLNGEDVTSLPMHLRARRGMSYLPQEPSIFRGLTVAENLMIILETLPLSRSERETRLAALLAELDIAHLANSRATALSGGERRRVEITRALIRSPSFLLLDEPFAGIDPIAIEGIQKIIARFKGKGIGILISDHNVRETLAITDRAYIIFEGNILVSGEANELIRSEKAREVFLGEAFRL